ncbi:MAG: GAF domain-containing protein [Candidatus Cloacimonetes bacterium]|nr:GAF domain-containing protein [Candidatus Cloacimonadota bacterium]
MSLIIHLLLVILIIKASIARHKFLVVITVCTALLSILIQNTFLIPSDYYYLNLIIVFTPCTLLITLSVILNRFLYQEGALLISSTTRAESLEESSTLIVNQFNEALMTKEQLEKQILKDDEFTLKFQLALEKIDSEDHNSVIHELLSSVKEFNKVESLSFYTLEKDLELTHSLYCKSKVLQTIDTDHHAIKHLVEKRRTVTVKEYPGVLQLEILMAFPIFLEDRLYGLLAIHEMDFFEMVKSNINLFEVFCRHAETIMERITRLQGFLEGFIEGNTADLSSLVFFDHMFTREVNLVKRYDLFASVITIVVEDRDDISDFDTLIKIIKTVSHNFLRNVDEFYFNENMDDRAHILLPMTDMHGTELVTSKINNTIDSHEIYPYESKKLQLRVSISSLQLTKTTQDDTIRAFRKANRI